MRFTPRLTLLPAILLGTACADLPTQNQAPAGASVDPLHAAVAATPDVIVYGAENGAGRGEMWKVNLTTGAAELVFDFTPPPGTDPFSPNGLAFHAASERLYYTITRSGSPVASELWFIDVNDAAPTPTLANNHLPGRIYNGDIWNDGFYYVINGTSSVTRVSLNPDGTAGAPVIACADIFDGNLAFGDIAIRDGVVYGSARHGTGVSGNPLYFFAVRLSDCARHFELKSPAQTNMLQLAWAQDGELYGHVTGTGEFFRVDPVTGDIEPAHAPIALPGVGRMGFFSDLAPGFTPPPPPTGRCEGGVNKLVVKYTGTTPLNDAAVFGARRNPGKAQREQAQISIVGGTTHYTFATRGAPHSGLFDPVANGRLANNFKLFIDSAEIVDFHTSCSAPIHPGLELGPAARRFEVVEVWSVKGGQVAAP